MYVCTGPAHTAGDLSTLHPHPSTAQGWTIPLAFPPVILLLAPTSHRLLSVYKTNKILKEGKERGSLFSLLCCCPSSKTIIHTWEKLASLGETCNKEQPQSILNTGNRHETSHRYINYQVNWSQHIGHIIDNLQMGACQSSTTTPAHTPGSARLLQTDTHNSEAK